MGLLGKNRECWDFGARIEDAATAAPEAKTSAELFAAEPVLRAHFQACASCREAAESLLITRATLSVMSPNADLGGHWFTSRVMAAIAERKAELAGAADTWTFLPKLAARLTWASSIVLLLASAWLYQKPASAPVQTTPKAVATDITGEPLVMDSAAPPSTDDEVLLSLAEKDRKPR